MMRRYNDGLRMSFACATLLVGLSTQVQAADEGGVGGLLQQLFGSSAQQTQPVQQVSPTVGQAAAPSVRTYAERRARRSEPTKLRLKTRYAALPKAEPLKVRITDRQTPIDMSQGPTAALLKDDTLRAGRHRGHAGRRASLRGGAGQAASHARLRAYRAVATRRSQDAQSPCGHDGADRRLARPRGAQGDGSCQDLPTA